LNFKDNLFAMTDIVQSYNKYSVIKKTNYGSRETENVFLVHIY